VRLFQKSERRKNCGAPSGGVLKEPLVHVFLVHFVHCTGIHGTPPTLALPACAAKNFAKANQTASGTGTATN